MQRQFGRLAKTGRLCLYFIFWPYGFYPKLLLLCLADMSLFITSLNSGSSGNCYYVGNAKEAVLIDAGISCREIEKRIKRLGLSVSKIKAVFISHEHTDHISGLQVFINKYALPVYITAATLRYAGLRLEETLVKCFSAHEPVVIGDLSVTAFPKSHDACDPFNFIVSCNSINVGVFTDMGIPCEHLVKYFKQCHAAFLETNYDDWMLDTGPYPYFLKNRIRGGKGHLSNKQALDLFVAHRPAFMSHLFLSHLSKNNNCPELVHRLFNQHANGVEIIVAPRSCETPVYHINTSIGNLVPPKPVTSCQLTFSFA